MNGKRCKNAAQSIEMDCQKGVVLEQKRVCRDSSSFLARTELCGRGCFCRQKPLVPGFHHGKREGHPVLDFWSLSKSMQSQGVGTRAALPAGRWAP